VKKQIRHEINTKFDFNFIFFDKFA
jgi:hypothetical protein